MDKPLDAVLTRLVEECGPCARNGVVADYIPELAKSDPGHLGVFLTDRNGAQACAGAWDVPFTIQSVAKPVVLLQCLLDRGEGAVRAAIGVESTGRPFNALDTEGCLTGQDVNPMVNLGTILMYTLVRGKNYDEKFCRIRALIRELADDPEIDVDEAVYRSERASAGRNRALGYFLQSRGLLTDQVEEVLDCHFKVSSLLVNCRDLARIAWALAGGREALVPPRYARYVNAILVTCGMYDASGDFAVRVGLPGKSGVGGGVMAVVPGRMGLGVYSPALDQKGNSVAGVALLESLKDELQLYML